MRNEGSSTFIDIYIYQVSIRCLRDGYLLDSVELGRRLVEFRFLDLSFETSRVTNDIGSPLLRGTHCQGNDLDLENPSYSTPLSHRILTFRHSFDHFIRLFHANLLSYRRVTYFDWSVNMIVDFLITKEFRTLREIRFWIYVCNKIFCIIWCIFDPDG